MSDSIADVASQNLDYLSMKRRSTAARNYRVKLNPTNSASIPGSSSAQCEFLLPGNLNGSYIDFSQMYFKFTLTTANASANFDKPGAYGLISRVEMYSTGAQLATINNYNVLMATLMDLDASIGYKCGAGKVLTGCSGTTSLGEYVGIGSRTYCLPLACLPFSMQSKLIPLFSLDSIRIRFTFENPAIAFVGSTSPTYTISDAQLCGYICELSPSAQQQIDAMTGGVYNILCPSYTNITTTQTGGTTALTATLGIAVSSLERIMVVHRADSAVTVAANQSLGARITNSLSSYQFSINSALYPQNPILVGTGNGNAEALAEWLVSNHSLSDFQNDAPICVQTYISALTLGGTTNASVLVSPYDAAYQYLNIPASSNISNAWSNASGVGSVLAADAAKGAVSGAGSFIASIELENSTSTGASSKLYSGVTTMSSVVQYYGTYATSSVDCLIDFFCYYTIMCSLNMRTTGVWQVSV